MIKKNKGEKNYFYSLSVNYTNRSPAVGNDSQNSINCRRRAAIIYELTINPLTNNSVARLYFIMPRIMLFSYSYARQKINNRKKSWFAGHFDDHADQAVRCQAHCPERQVYGYPRCHWTPPSGNYSPRIASADAMVINFCVKNWVVALWKSLFEACVQRHETDPLLSSLKQQAAWKGRTPRLKPKSTANFLAIKR